MISVLCTLITVITITNILLICLLFKTNQLGLVINHFVLTMSISDICTGGIFLPFTLIYYGFLSYSKTIEDILFVLSSLFVHFSALMVLAIAMDRCIHVNHLRSNRKFLSKLKAKIIIAGSFILALGYAIFLLRMSHTRNTRKVILGICIYGGILLLSVGSIYIRLSCKVRQSTREINVGSFNSRQQPRRQVDFLTKTVAIILLSLVCCYLPYLTIGVIISFHSKGSCNNKTLTKLFIASHCLLYIYTAINALIIIFRNRAIVNYIWAKLNPHRNVTNIEQFS